jgi:phage regulator Rha-like protein
MKEALMISLPDELVINKIFVIRNIKVMVDRDLAELYGVETKQLKRTVRRNINRFPEDFMFELSEKEISNLRCQIGTSSWGGVRYKPMAFTEQGVAMLSSILSSERAITVNIQIIRIFTKMRELLSSHKEILQKLESIEKKDIEQDEKILMIFEYLRQLDCTKQEEAEFRERSRIGFKP